jgi:hypothetical protein
VAVGDEANSANQAERHQATTDFGLLELDLSLKSTPRTAPNPLRAATPERLEHARQAVRGIVAARHAGRSLPDH